MMNMLSPPTASESRARTSVDHRPILIVPYMWIGDFVRCHSVVKVLKARYPARPVDVLATTLCAPLADYMPEVRQAVILDLPPTRLPSPQHTPPPAPLKQRNYVTP